MEPLPSHSDSQPPPRHVAIIMDGNGRWAKARGLPRTEGHRRGMAAVRRTVEGAIEMGVAYLTLYGFSSENWNRPVGEVQDLMGLLRIYLRREVAELHRNGVRLRFIGNRERLAPDIVRLIEDSEELTRRNTRLNLIIALSYGSRDEILYAVRGLMREAAEGRIDPDSIDEEAFSKRLLTADIPDPDLIVRTSGEQRLSNFLLWQSAYAELIFTPCLWPDFGPDELRAAVDEFQTRDRRYGAAVG
jgi:undecaprenyl diphosphate synthase